MTSLEMKNNSAYGLDKLISHEVLFEKYFSLLDHEKKINAKLAIVCEISFVCEKQLEHGKKLETGANIEQDMESNDINNCYEKMFENKLFTDFEIKCNDEESLYAHRVILAAKSPVFMGMMTNDMEEAAENCVTLHDVDSVTMKELLRYIYCETVENIDALAPKLIYEAEKYHLDNLKMMCKNSLISNLSADNVLDNLIIASRLSCVKDLFEKCVDVILTYLLLYLNGNNDSSKSFVSLFLCLSKPSEMTFDIKYKLGISSSQVDKDLMGPLITMTSEEMKNDLGYGFDKLIAHKVLFEKYFSPLDHEKEINAKLAIVCEISLVCEKQLEHGKKLETGANIEQDMESNDINNCYEKMFENKLFTDFEIKCNDEESLYAHRVILAAKSPVFMGMMTNDMEEAAENCVTLHDVDSVTMKELLRYIYCETVESIDALAPKLIYEAEKYHLDNLKMMCKNSLISNLSIDNVLDNLIIASRLSCVKDLFEKCVDVILTNFQFSAPWKLFKKLPPDVCYKYCHELMQRLNTIHI
ncbi:CLUMA_CG011590, isoform A [Clunio marinus]|uniref:CLUMA_CG011590, isoform A n=1 Tax=Clunio marinus TaxID=568069 RepID=A0A1J1IDD4_9DIPT|nr:CLUMA_CG011590, isoform A [Clunio marinus]